MRLPFPHHAANTICTAQLYTNGVSEDGGPIVFITWTGPAIFSEKSFAEIDETGKTVTLIGKVIFNGDIAPSLGTIGDGVATIGTNKYQIHRSERPRNPDGSIHHTTLVLR